MSARIRVRVTAEFEIDPQAYVAAAVEAKEIDMGELDPADHAAIADAAVGYCDAEDRLPRWARDAMRVTHESIEVLP